MKASHNKLAALPLSMAARRVLLINMQIYSENLSDDDGGIIYSSCTMCTSHCGKAMVMPAAVSAS